MSTDSASTDPASPPPTEPQRPEPKEVANATFEGVASRVSFPEQERAVLDFWREQDIFRRSVEQRPADRIYSFYEGPPTANGNPGIHHVLARAFKDLIPRYRTMRGYRVPRKGGWDTHGLPVELEVERQLGLSSKPEIEAYGVEAFNARCRESVFSYVTEWERMTERIGFWVDMDDPYVTYHREYIESGWWIFKQLWDGGLIYQGYRVTPHCPRCETSLSSHEIALGYREDTPDPSVTVRFRVAENAAAPPELRPGDGVPTSILAWTTTPWTLPGNTALAVSPEATYVLAEVDAGQGLERLIVAEDLWAQITSMNRVADGEVTVLARFPGTALVGLEYEPLFESSAWEGVEPLAFVDGRAQPLNGGAAPARRVIAADFVGTEDGTGVVHVAPAFGEDDYEAGRREGLLFLQPVSSSGAMVGGPFAGQFVKDADPVVTADLRERGLLWDATTIRHTYPFCWRCDTPVLYYAKPSWYIRTTAVRDQLVEQNQRIHWVPEHIRDGRFGEWLKGNVDWAVSRERYWGTPLPIWLCERCGTAECMASLAELQERAGLDAPPEDPHRPFIDEITFACQSPGCGATMRRTPEVADGWFDSGAMPYAQWHYPFEHADTFAERFPADFICEAVDQTRGWFYTLHALATLLNRVEAVPEGIAFHNVICLGHILDGDGLKMSKSRGNIVEPFEVLDTHGADAVRWYMYTAAPPGNSRRFSADLVAETARRFLSTLWNTYSFFVTYANIASFDPATQAVDGDRTELDRWVRSELHRTVREVTEALEAYEPADAARPIAEFVDQLSNWYVRRSRRRFWKSDDSADTQAALHTLYECLVTVSKLLAPFTPFVSEVLHRNLVAGKVAGAPESVHLDDWPEVDETAIDEQLSAEIATVQRMVSLTRGARSKAGVKVRQPLATALLVPRTAAERAALERHAAQVAEELNVKRIEVAEDGGSRLSYSLRPNLPVLGPRYGKELRRVRAALNEANPTAVARLMRSGSPIPLDGFELTATDVLIDVQAAAGWSAAEESGYLALLDTTITPELEAEGLARDLVRQLQELRREAGLEVTDRIRVTFSGDATTGAVFAEHGAYIAAETLALSLDDAAPPAGSTTATATLGGHEVTLAVRRA